MITWRHCVHVGYWPAGSPGTVPGALVLHSTRGAMSALPSCHAELSPHPGSGVHPGSEVQDLGSRSGIQDLRSRIWGPDLRSGVWISGSGVASGVGVGFNLSLYIISPRARGTVNYKSGSPLNERLAVPKGYDIAPEGMDPWIQDRFRGAQTMTKTGSV